MKVLKFFFCFFYFFFVKSLPQIKLPKSLILGRFMISESGFEYLAFLGIPYALPPAGQLRFKPPVPIINWPNILEATQFKSPCPQFDASGQLIGSEDCLNLNIFAKINNSKSLQKKLLPVMVYIHAESFENGDSSLYGPEKLMDKNIILVTFNYRLGILGFLSTNDENSFGNFGLYDQILALKWIQENIFFFGGDPNQVTLFGQGAGAASIMYHLMSNSSTNLFHKAILQSGSNLCNWSLERNPYDYFKKISEKVGCSKNNNSKVQQQKQSNFPNSIQDKLKEIIPINGIFRDKRTINRMDSFDTEDIPLVNYKEFTDKEKIDCLRNKPLISLLKAQSDDKIFGEFPQRTAPSISMKGLIKEEPLITLKKGDFLKKPLIIGLNKDETAYFIPLLFGDNKPTLSYEYLEKSVIPKFVEATISFHNKPKTKVVSEIMHHYFTNVDWNNITQIIHQFVKMSTDGAYGNCIDETAKLYSNIGGLIFFYSYEYRGTNSMLDLLVNLQNEVNSINVAYRQNQKFPNDFNSLINFDNGVCHGDELFSLFNLKTGNLKSEKNYDKLIQNRLITLWTEFAATDFFNQSISYENNFFIGPQSIWPIYNYDEKYLIINDQIKVSNSYRKYDLDFWKLLFDKEVLLMYERKNHQTITDKKYITLAITLLTTTILLLIAVTALLVLLWYSKKKKSFKTSIPGICHSNPCSY